MKILAIHSIQDPPLKNESAIDIWRVWRPLEELKKHVDWQIDYQTSIIKDVENLESASDVDIEAIGAQLGEYDIIFSSYQPQPNVFALLHAVEKKYGTKFVLDVDDDMFNIEPDSLFWRMATKQDEFMMQTMLKLSKYITTTSKVLADRFAKASEVDAKITVIPNYIPDAYRSEANRETDKIVIGYFGGASHYFDLHETGILPAVKKIMHKYKNVHFVSVGVPIDYYLPNARTSHIEGINGRKWIDELFPTLSIDIAVAPVRHSKFAEGKSNIKWLESTRMGAAFVASNVGPYRELSNATATRVANIDQDWYRALEQLVLNAAERKRLVEKSAEEISENWRLEDHWMAYKDMFEEIYKHEGGQDGSN